jgi:hypothetical protein
VELDKQGLLLAIKTIMPTERTTVIVISRIVALKRSIKYSWQLIAHGDINL